MKLPHPTFIFFLLSCSYKQRPEGRTKNDDKAMPRLHLLRAKHCSMDFRFVISLNPPQLNDTVTSGTLFYRGKKREKESTVTGVRSLVGGSRVRSQTHTQTLIRDPQAHSHPSLQQTRLLHLLLVSIVKHRVLLCKLLAGW